jgi:hypothetical protein
MAIIDRRKRLRQNKEAKLVLLGGQVPIREEAVFTQKPFNFGIEISDTTILLTAKPLRWSSGSFGTLYYYFSKIAEIYKQIGDKEITADNIKLLSSLPLYLSSLLEFHNRDEYIQEIENAANKKEISRHAKKRLFFERLKINSAFIPEHLKSLKNKPLLSRYFYWMLFGCRQIEKLSLEKIKLIAKDIETSQILELISYLDIEKLLILSRHIIDFNSGPLKKKLFLN